MEADPQLAGNPLRAPSESDTNPLGINTCLAVDERATTGIQLTLPTDPIQISGSVRRSNQPTCLPHYHRDTPRRILGLGRAPRPSPARPSPGNNDRTSLHPSVATGSQQSRQPGPGGDSANPSQIAPIAAAIRATQRSLDADRKTVDGRNNILSRYLDVGAFAKAPFVLLRESLECLL